MVLFAKVVLSTLALLPFFVFIEKRLGQHWVYDDFAGRLLEKYQLTGRERDVCYLKALDFSDDEISELLKIQLRSEERWIYRICEKFGFPKGSKDDFAAYIADFKKRR